MFRIYRKTKKNKYEQGIYTRNFCFFFTIDLENLFFFFIFVFRAAFDEYILSKIFYFWPTDAALQYYIYRNFFFSPIEHFVSFNYTFFFLFNSITDFFCAFFFNRIFINLNVILYCYALFILNIIGLFFCVYRIFVDKFFYYLKRNGKIEFNANKNK